LIFQGTAGTVQKSYPFNVTMPSSPAAPSDDKNIKLICTFPALDPVECVMESRTHSQLGCEYILYGK